MDALVNSARIQTSMTHNNVLVTDSAAFFAAAVFRILQGDTPIAAIKATAATQFNREPFQTWVNKGIESSSSDTLSAIKKFGQMCGVDAAFPAMIHLVARYEDNLQDALIENVMAGGDSAARGMIAGLLLGAFHGIAAIPESWLTEMAAHKKIISLLADIDT
jgi:ADP-ribosylglycohydrolase